MPKFFEDSFSPESPVLTGTHVRHIGFALRMRPGEQITVCSCGTDYLCEITEIRPEAVQLRILSAESVCTEPDIRVTLFQALPKSDKFEQIVQKAIELGVTEIVPVMTARCVSRPSAGEFLRKLPRYQKIAQAAAQQSGRGVIPPVAPLHTLAQAAERMQGIEMPLVLYEAEGGCSFSEIPADAKEYAVFVGSEGGFESSEIALLQAQGVRAVWLGKRILRCETAPLTALSVLMYRTGNLG